MNQHNHSDLKASASTKLMNDVIRTSHFLLYSHSVDLCAAYRLSVNENNGRVVLKKPNNCTIPVLTSEQF